MARFNYTPLASLLNPTTAATQINSNFALLAILLDELLSRQGDNPNTMSADLDMNSQRIVNLPAPSNNTEPVRLIDFLTFSFNPAALPATRPDVPGVLWNNGGFICIS